MRPDSVDVRRFQHHLDLGDIEAALAEWKGTPLAGLDAGTLTPIVDGLSEQWLSAVELDLAHRLEQDPPSTIGALTELTANYPFREGLWVLLMTALYRTGRQADALAAYRTARHHLVDHLGVEPGTRLKALETAVLSQDPTLASAGPRATGAVFPTGMIAFGCSEIDTTHRRWRDDRSGSAAAAKRHDELARTVAAEHAGQVWATNGRSVSVAFGKASEALSWAKRIQHAAADALTAEGGLLVRIGLHVGEADERNGNYFGPTVDLAARLAGAGHGGQTLLSTSAAALVDDEILVDLGAVRFTDTWNEQRVHQLGDSSFPPLRVSRERVGPQRPAGRLIGRTDAIDAAMAAADAFPVVTLVGPGGIGKTRLALELAHRRERTPVWFVELAGVSSSTDVERTVADVLQVTEAPARPLLSAILRALAHPGGLLVIDNCEHVIDGAAALVDEIVSSRLDVTVLCTSREGLGVPGEQLVAVGPLDPTMAAVELFTERALAADRSFDITHDPESVVEICRRLDGVPLAIELAAARIRSHAPADIVAQLDRSLRLLTGGRRASVERHRTLQATVRWSYDLLDDAERLVFRRLSVFVGPFDMRAAESVVADETLCVDDVTALVGDLVDRSMVGVESAGFGRRYRLLETIRQFGAESLAETGETEQIASRHAAFVNGEVERISVLLDGRDEVRGVYELSELWPNLRTAVDWALAHGDVTLTTTLIAPISTQVFFRRGVGEISDWAERLLDIVEDSDDETITHALLWIALHHTMTQDVDRFDAVAQSHPAPDGVLGRFGMAIIKGDRQRILDLGPEAITAAKARNESSLAMLFEIFVGGNMLQADNLAEAATFMDDLTERFREQSAPPTYMTWALYLAGATAAMRGDDQGAERLYLAAASVDVPPRTNTPNETLAARQAFNEGDHDRAFSILRSYVEELLYAGNHSGLVLVGLEFVTMTNSLDRLELAAIVVGHLRSEGFLRDPNTGLAALIADVAVRVDNNPTTRAIAEQAQSRDLDQRDTLRVIQDILDVLIVELRRS
ncbi:MAG: BTAD domain-containing putative transcriptional regulator [Ornithinimicrobium sp.]